MAQRQFRSDDTSKWTPKYGNGSDGNKTVSANADYDGANAGGGSTAASGQKTVVVDAASSFADGDLVLIHQSRGTGAGAWELNKIVSGGGTTSLVMAFDLCNTYTESGNSQFQVVELKQYRDVTVNSGITWSCPDWDGSKGGIIAFLANGTITVTGTISCLGDDSVSGGGSGSVRNPTNGGGFRGGWSQDTVNSTGGQGESPTGAPGNSTSANGSGGGAGAGNSNYNAGGGGGHATAGGNATGSGSQNGAGGSTSGDNAALTTAHFGGGGGGSTGIAGSSTASGANGGGWALVIGKTIVITGLINCNGGSNLSGARVTGGAAAGGSALLKGIDVTLGTNKITVAGGTVNSSPEVPGVGGVGRIHVDYAKSLSGTTSPTGTDSTQDRTLFPTRGGAALMLIL